MTNSRVIQDWDLSRSSHAVWRTSVWLAWCWLTRPRLRRSSLAAVVTISVTLMLAMLAGGLLRGYSDVERYQIESDPIRLSFWLHGRGARNSIFCHSQKDSRSGDREEKQFKLEEGIINLEECVEIVRKELRKKGSNDDMRGYFPYHTLNWCWAVGVEDRGTIWYDFWGRTIAAGDPLFQSFRFLRGRPLREDDEGIVVTPSLLKALGFREDGRDCPETLTVRVLRKPQKLKVIGVTEKELPERFSYIVPATFRLRLEEDDVEEDKMIEISSSIFTGPVPAGWPAPDALPQGVWDKLRTRIYKDLGLEEKEDDASWKPTQRELREIQHWSFSLPNERQESRGKWLEWMKELHEWMKGEGFPSGEEFYENIICRYEGKPPGEGGPPVDLHEFHFDRAVLYFKEASSLITAYRALTAAGDTELGTNDDERTIERADKLDKTLQQGAKLLNIVGIIVCVSAAFNLYVIQGLRAQLKITEIGMLKAIGMTSGGIRAICLLEALFLWLGSVILGLGVAVLVGRFVGRRWFANETLREIASKTLEEPLANNTLENLSFYSGWPLLVSLAAGSLVVCIGTTLWATKEAVAKPPIETLTAN